MSEFRVVGISCDAQTKWTDEGNPVHTYGPNAVGADCGEEFTLFGGARVGDVRRDAVKEGWVIKGRGLGKAFLCPAHAEATEAS